MKQPTPTPTAQTIADINLLDRILAQGAPYLTPAKVAAIWELATELSPGSRKGSK